MANDEWLVQRQSQQQAYSVPTAAMFGGNFSQLSDHHLRSDHQDVPSPATSFHPTSIDPISQKLLKYYDSAHAAGLRPTTTSRTTPLPSTATASSCAWISSNRRNRNGPAAIAGATKINPTQTINISGSKIPTGYEQYLGSNTRILSPNLVNEARFGYTRFYNALSTLSGVRH